jgi:hypothetical protein
MVDRQNSDVSLSFDLPTTSVTTVQGILTPVLDKLKAAVPAIPAVSTHRPLHAARDPQIEIATPPIGIADEIAKLGELRSQGLLTDEEFNAQKLKLLGKP